MQNLFVKILVLGSVIGSSCFVVWQAHDGLKSAADKIAPGEFVALDQEKTEASPPAANQAEIPAAKADWEQPLKLSETTATEPQPTLAAPVQREEESAEKQTFDPLAATPAPADRTLAAQEQPAKESPQALPLFFEGSLDQEAPPATARAMPVAQMEQPEPETSLPAPQQNESDDKLVGKANPTRSSQEFVELPGQQVIDTTAEQKSEAMLPEAEPLPTPALMAAPTQSESTELPTSPFDALNPSSVAADPKTPPSKAKETPRDMPGLTRLPPSHPGPVLLSLDDKVLPPADNGVVRATGTETNLPVIEKTSNSISTDLPAGLKAATAESHAPGQLPQLEVMVKRERREPIAIEEKDVADPIGMKSPSPAPGKMLAVTPSSEPQPTPRQAPLQFPDTPVPAERATREPVPTLETSSPLPVEETPVLPADPLSRSSAPAMPPLPPTGEVLPDPLPNAEKVPVVSGRSPLSSPATSAPPSVNDEVLPFPEPSAAQERPSMPVGPSMPMQNDLALPPPADSNPLGLPPGPSPVTPLPSRSAPAQIPEVMPDIFPASPPARTVDPIAPAATPATESVSPHLLMGTGDLDGNAPTGAQSPELKIEKIAPSEAEVGEPVIYAIVIRNVGGSEARDVVVEDRIPRGAQLEGTIPQAYLNDGKLSWQLGTIEPGGERKIQLKVVPVEAGQIGSVATVSFAAAVSASIKVNSPKLTIDMAGPKEAALGEPMNFRFVLKNLGQSPAKSVFLRTILPAGLTHPGGNDLEYESGLIAPGEEKIVNLVVQAEKEGPYTITSQVTNDGKIHADTRTSFNVIKSRLQLSRTGPENRFVGRPAQFTLRIGNTSSEILKGITIQEKIPADVELATIPGGGQWDPKTRLLSWRLDQLNPGEFREINVTYLAKGAGEHHGQLMAMDAAGNKCTLETVLNAKGFSELTPHYEVDQRTVMVNERVTMQVTLENAGTASSRNVRAQFILPEGVEFVSAQGPGENRLSGNQVVFASLNELAPGSKQTFHLALVPHQAGTAKITFKLEADDYSDPVFQDQAIRIIAAGQ